MKCKRLVVVATVMLLACTLVYADYGTTAAMSSAPLAAMPAAACAIPVPCPCMPCATCRTGFGYEPGWGPASWMSWMCGRVGVEWAYDSGYLGASVAKIEVFDSTGHLDGTSAASAQLASMSGFTQPYCLKWFDVSPGVYEALVSYPAAVKGPWELQISVTQAGMETEVLPFAIWGGDLP